MAKNDAEVSDWDLADYLKTEEDVIYLLEEALEDYDPAAWQLIISDIARSTGMAKIARKAGLNRESLYKALKEDAHPRFDTIMRVLKAMGFKLMIAPITPVAPDCVAEKTVKYSAKKKKTPKSSTSTKNSRRS